MKQLLLLPMLLLSACASHPPKKVIVAPATPLGRPVRSDGLRFDDQLREYRIGRYVDARDPLVMHEGHPVYRVESSARWDLRPGSTVPRSPRGTVTTTSVSSNDAVVAEVNKQRAATRAFTEQTAALNQRLTELGEAVGQTQEIAKQNLALKREVAALRDNLNALDAQLRQRKPASSSPAPSPDDKW
ncbi:MAG: hypothetical protein H0W20_09200 [Chthoniobacterales bacterium]|nr:hypothetical protein [Chthoniobacterales bacterium]